MKFRVHCQYYKSSLLKFKFQVNGSSGTLNQHILGANLGDHLIVIYIVFLEYSTTSTTDYVRLPTSRRHGKIYNDPKISGGYTVLVTVLLCLRPQNI